MDGISDPPTRLLARRMGSAMSYTEFINAIDVVQNHPHLWEHLQFSEEERPFVIQVFDDDPQRMYTAIQQLVELRPDVIDVNMGCSSKNVSGRGAGAGLLQTPEKVAQIFHLLSRNLSVPVTGKIRLGWDEDSKNYLQIARIVEDNGGQALAVHGRTRQQGYQGSADWDAIAEIKQHVSIPVIGNGDVRCVADVARMKAHTGCDAVMVGRGAMGNPWIFAGVERHSLPPGELLRVMQLHVNAMASFYGQERGVTLFRKHAARYLADYNLNGEQRGLLFSFTAVSPLVEYLATLLQAG
ncbi:MAG: tRNA dihydrouridine synthase DusB [Chloroflexi bacterium]|nr:tRNA dihydrouridine synthase DusB [Chloroflexota bacterium]